MWAVYELKERDIEGHKTNCEILLQLKKIVIGASKWMYFEVRQSLLI